MTRISFITLMAAVSLFAASCGGSDDEATSTTAATDATEATTTTAAPTTEAPTTEAPTTEAPTTEAPTTTEPDEDALPETPVAFTLDQAYDFVGGTPDPALLPAEPRSVEALVYRTATTYAVVYRGLGVDVAACPGNSIFTAAGFEHVSNAALPAGSCDAFPTLIQSTATQGVQICGDQVSYLTLIPVDVAGAIFVSIETPVDTEINGVGITGSLNIFDPSLVPEIDPAALSC